MVSTIAVISDIHSNSWALEAVLNDIQDKGINKIINLGDSIYGPLDPFGTIDKLIDNKVISILGNEDKILINSYNSNLNNPMLNIIREDRRSIIINWLENLSDELYFEDYIYCCHGSPTCNSNYLLETISPNNITIKSNCELENELSEISQKLILCGHSHVPNVVELDKKLIINPGSVGLQAYFDDFPYPHKIENCSHYAKYSIIISTQNAIKVEQISVPYNYNIPALLAENNGFFDWSGWIQTGRAY